MFDINEDDEGLYSILALQFITIAYICVATMETVGNPDAFWSLSGLVALSGAFVFFAAAAVPHIRSYRSRIAARFQ